MGADRPAGGRFQFQAPFRRHPLAPAQDFADRLGRDPHHPGRGDLAFQVAADDGAQRGDAHGGQ